MIFFVSSRLDIYIAYEITHHCKGKRTGYTQKAFRGAYSTVFSRLRKPTLVTTYGLKMNMYSNRIQRVVTMDALFG